MMAFNASVRPRPSGAPRQRGLTLIEFMVSIGLGMIIVAALATLIADQSGNRAEVDRSGRLIENGRYAIRFLAEDLQMAGYLGELSTAPAGPTAWATPCASGTADVQGYLGQHLVGFDVPGAAVRAGYNGTAPLPAPPSLPSIELTCLSNIKPGTDVIVVRRVDPDSSAYETAGATDTTKLASATNPVNDTRLFLQTGLATTNLFDWRLNTGANHASFDLKKKSGAMATVRRVVVRIFYVTTCSVCSGSNADRIPTLKMRELIQGPAWSDPITISEGIENLQVEWGLDSAPVDGSADGADVAAGSIALEDWQKTVTAKIYLLARSVEPSPGYEDTKTYPLGLAGTVTPVAVDANGVEEKRYKRHVFVQSVRFINASARRSL